MRIISALLLLTSTVALATDTMSLESDQRNALTTIDVVPTKPQIDRVFGPDALLALASIATDTNTNADPGIRLRAIHALAKYCGGPATPCSSSELAHQSVSSVISNNRTATAGSQVLLLRAAIETLGTMRVPADITTLRPLLEHPSRDIRAATARALRDLCNTQAITDLRARYAVETTDQVKLAISEALRILGQCATNP